MNPYARSYRDRIICEYCPMDVECWLPDSLELISADDPWNDRVNYPTGHYQFAGWTGAELAARKPLSSAEPPEDDQPLAEIEAEHRKWVLGRIKEHALVLAWRLGRDFDRFWATLYRPGVLAKADTATLDRINVNLRARVEVLYQAALED